MLELVVVLVVELVVVLVVELVVVLVLELVVVLVVEPPVLVALGRNQQKLVDCQPLVALELVVVVAALVVALEPLDSLILQLYCQNE